MIRVVALINTCSCQGSTCSSVVARLHQLVALTTSLYQEKMREGVLEEYDKHEDSVYSVAWSTVDPWLFASLSNDGRLVLNKVSKEIKFNIIL